MHCILLDPTGVRAAPRFRGRAAVCVEGLHGRCARAWGDAERVDYDVAVRLVRVGHGHAIVATSERDNQAVRRSEQSGCATERTDSRVMLTFFVRWTMWTLVI